jgi:hypothetical protein
MILHWLQHVTSKSEVDISGLGGPAESTTPRKTTRIEAAPTYRAKPYARSFTFLVEAYEDQTKISSLLAWHLYMSNKDRKWKGQGEDYMVWTSHRHQ